MCIKDGNYTKWLISNRNEPLYLPKANRQLAEALALRKYYTLQLKELTIQYNLIDKFLQHIQQCKIKSSSLLMDSSYYKELLHPYFQSFPDELQLWINEEYTRNMNHPDNLIHKTLSGIYVRSKSEVIIANALYLNKIPFRYECELCLNDIKFYPDFTIFHPETKQIIFWEHFGMMDVTAYRENAYSKLKLYGNYNILPSINLITTYETKKNPIDSEKIQQIIQDFFLS